MVVQLTALLSERPDRQFGRRWTTFVLGFVCWCLPAAVCMFAQGFCGFLSATVLNGFHDGRDISWNCLLVEDAEPSRLVISTPGSRWPACWRCFSHRPRLDGTPQTLVPAIRYVYGFAFVMKTAKTVILFFHLARDRTGKNAMKETRGVPYVRLLAQYSGARPYSAFACTLQCSRSSVLLNITNMIANTYFALFATRNAGVPEWVVSYFPIARSLIMLGLSSESSTGCRDIRSANR
jgi:hypothetical protein